MKRLILVLIVGLTYLPLGMVLVGCGNDEKESNGDIVSRQNKDEHSQLIAFTSRDENHRQAVFTIKSDGTGLENITKGWGQSVALESWFPDSSGLLITSEHTENLNVYLMELPSRQTTAITNFKDLVFFGDISCSPDGKSIFLVGNHNLAEQSILPRGDLQILEKGWCETPLCSPNGKWVSFLKSEADDSHSRDVWVFSRIERKTYPLVTAKGFDGMVSWLPNDHLVFVSGEKVCQVAVPSGEFQKLMEGYHPSASPNGKYVAFLRKSHPVLTDLNVMDLKTLQVIYTFTSEKYNCQPRSAPRSISWSPNSQELIFIGEYWTEEDIASRLHGPPSAMGRMDHDHSLIKVDLIEKNHSVIFTVPKEAIFDVEWSPK